MSPSSHIISIIIITLLISINNSYYLSSNGLWAQAAETFCVNHCSSNLASIHNDDQYSEIKDIITNDPTLRPTGSISADDHLWIGLNDASLNGYQWTDGSTFDFGNNTSGGSYPWSSGEPSSSYLYTQMTIANNFEWNIASNLENAQFVCNSCDWTKLSKYIFINDVSATWSGAELLCNNNFATNLASIHTDADVAESTYVKMSHISCLFRNMFL